MGHAGEGMSDLYDKIKEDVAFRKEVANACGVGFEVPATFFPIEPSEPKIQLEAGKEVVVCV